MSSYAFAVAEDSFANLLNETLGDSGSLDGAVLRGTVVAIRGEHVLVDVGLKSEGYVPVREFGGELPNPGDEIDVYVERYEDKNGEIVLSRERARREEVWVDLERCNARNEYVNGTMFGRVKGGFTVDLRGAVAFLPNSQVDVRPIRDHGALMGVEQPFQILKMDKKRGNIVVSRRAIMEESRAEARSDLVASIHEGKVLLGLVKNITEYGAFVDLGGVDGLLHVTDISWKRITHPKEMLSVGQQVNVLVTKRISLGMKQLEEDPWFSVQQQFQVGDKYSGVVANVAEYGAFVELAPGIEGLVHVSEMSWTKKNPDIMKMVQTGQTVQVVVLEVDNDKRRISLGMKQAQENPFAALADKLGTSITATIKAVSEVGLVLDLSHLGAGDIEGIVLPQNLVWEGNAQQALKTYSKGQEITAKIISLEGEHDKVGLGSKQLTADPFGDTSDLRKGCILTCIITAVQENGVEVSYGNNITSFIRRSDLSRDRSEQRPDRFAVGEKVDAMITTVDKATRKVSLSIKARELDEEKAAMAEFGSTDSGASLGDILGPALQQKTEN